jgi:hypothetical protein
MKVIAIASRLCVGLLLAGSVASCKGPELLGPAFSIGDVVTRVTTEDGTVTAVLHAGMAPEPGASAAPTVPAQGTAVNGGSAVVQVDAGADFTTVIVAMAGADGYYQLTLPAGASTAELILGLSPDLPSGTQRLQYAVGDGATIGAYSEQAMRMFRVGTGDVQISISWTGASDVDLHVFDPSGEEVYWANRVAASGGELDLDSNPGCTIDNTNNENIVWASGTAPAGEYRVVVDYWADCGVPRSDYVVTVALAGQQPLIFSGSFVGDDTENPDREIGTFTF